MFSNMVVYANATGTPAPTTAAALVSSFLPFIVLIAFFWLVILRPQKKREKQTREMLAALKVGDEVTSIGGIVGKVSKIKDDRVTIEVGADKTKIEFERRAIASVAPKKVEE